MRARGRTVPVVLAAVAAVACAVAPFLSWVTLSGQNVQCGWTCYVPLPAGSDPRDLIGADGWYVSTPLQIALLVLAALVAGAAAAHWRGGPAARRAWAVAAVGAAIAFAWALYDILDWTAAAGGDDPVNDAFAVAGPGGTVALLATAGATLVSAAVLLRDRGTRRR